MSTEQYELLLKLVMMALATAAAFGGIVPIVNWIKGTLGISGRWVQFVAVIVSVVFAILTGIAQGVLAPESFTAEQFIITAGLVLTLSQTEYGRWLRAQEHQSGEASDTLEMAQAIGKV